MSLATMTFRVGQKVVCVDDTFEPIARHFFSALPCVEGTYTIRAIGRWSCGPWSGHVGVLLVGIQGKPIADPANPFGEAGFRVERFRPIVERKTDISIFKRLLTPVHGDPELVGDAR